MALKSQNSEDVFVGKKSTSCFDVTKSRRYFSKGVLFNLGPESVLHEEEQSHKIQLQIKNHSGAAVDALPPGYTQLGIKDAKDTVTRLRGFSRSGGPIDRVPTDSKILKEDQDSYGSFGDPITDYG